MRDGTAERKPFPGLPQFSESRGGESAALLPASVARCHINATNQPATPGAATRPAECFADDRAPLTRAESKTWLQARPDKRNRLNRGRG